jgi:hypothetical protein
MLEKSNLLPFKKIEVMREREREGERERNGKGEKMGKRQKK